MAAPAAPHGASMAPATLPAIGGGGSLGRERSGMSTVSGTGGPAPRKEYSYASTTSSKVEVGERRLTDPWGGRTSGGGDGSRPGSAGASTQSGAASTEAVDGEEARKSVKEAATRRQAKLVKSLTKLLTTGRNRGRRTRHTFSFATTNRLQPPLQPNEQSPQPSPRPDDAPPAPPAAAAEHPRGLHVRLHLPDAAPRAHVPAAAAAAAAAADALVAAAAAAAQDGLNAAELLQVAARLDQENEDFKLVESARERAKRLEAILAGGLSAAGGGGGGGGGEEQEPLPGSTAFAAAAAAAIAAAAVPAHLASDVAAAPPPGPEALSLARRRESAKAPSMSLVFSSLEAPMDRPMSVDLDALLVSIAEALEADFVPTSRRATKYDEGFRQRTERYLAQLCRANPAAFEEMSAAQVRLAVERWPFQRYDPTRRDGILQIIRTREPGVAGPFYLGLPQGFTGAFVRYPIYIPDVDEQETFGFRYANNASAIPYSGLPAAVRNCSVCYNSTTREKWWGLLTVLVNYDAVTQGKDAYLANLRKMRFNYALVRPINDTAEQIIAQVGPSSLRNDDAVTVPVKVLSSIWLLRVCRVAPEAGFQPLWRAPLIFAVVIIALVVATL
ncbi:hypothetical protein TSOC_011547, partial [Tetrabaena socialis]